MKIKLGGRSYTFVIIPDANNKVRRFRLSVVVLTAIPASVILVFCLAVSMYVVSQNTALEKRDIAARLAEQTIQYEQTVNENRQTIEELENNIIELSQQTEMMKLKMTELQQLEEELLDISGSELGMTVEQDKQSEQPSNDETATTLTAYSPSVSSSVDELFSPSYNQPGSPSASGIARSDRPVSISGLSPFVGLSDIPDSYVGGPAIGVAREDISSLIDSTRASLNEMDGTFFSLMTNLERTKEHMLEQIQLMRITPTFWPTNSEKISSRFGYRKDPFSRKPAMHNGLDIAGKSGDDVYAAADGVVTSAEYDRAYGYNVIIKHASGVSTRYAHLRKYTVKSGQFVSQGEKIGLLGSTGKSTGPHLHFEVIKNGKAVDPAPYLLSTGKGVD